MRLGYDRHGGLRTGSREEEPVLRRPSFVWRAAGSALGAWRPPFVLCYHGVGETHGGDDPQGVIVASARFRNHLDILEAWGYALCGVSEIWRIVQADPTIEGAGALAFDDGLAETLFRVAALLEGRGSATAFIPSGLLGRPHPDLFQSHPIVTARQLQELAAAGMEIGSHSVDHPDLSRLPYAEALDQLRRSKATLEDVIGTRVSSLSYPYGRYTRETIAAAREAGYDCACATSGGGDWRPYELPREGILPSTPVWRLKLKAQGLDAPLLSLARLRNRARQLFVAAPDDLASTHG